MRVTQRSMYNNYMDSMQSTLSAYMETNMQGGTQKKVNRPSDDPAGMALILNTRNDIARSQQYEKNADAAEGWLNLAQYTLGTSVSTAISKIKTLAEQASTGTYTAEQREAIATELRQMFGQMINLSNTEFGDKSLFAGHKYDESAFDEILAVSTRDPNLKDANFEVSGKSEYTQLVEFTSGGKLSSTESKNLPTGTQTSATGTTNEALVRFDDTVDLKSNGTDFDYSFSEDGGTTWTQASATTNGSGEIDLTNPISGGSVNVNTSTTNPANSTITSSTAAQITVNASADVPASMEYRWSGDGGKTWETGTYTPDAPPNNTITHDGITLTIPETGTITPYVAAQPDADPPIEASGTRLMIRPTTIYNGDTNDRPPKTLNMGGPTGMETEATGTFKNDVLVRFDEDVDLGAPKNGVLYSYSEDNGATWTQATVDLKGDDKVRLTVPGGYVEVETPAGTPTQTIEENTQVLISPNRADLGYEIMDDTYISVTSVGKDFFGGRYGDPLSPVDGLEGNLFETIGDLIGYCETNDQAGIEASLEKITKSHEEILTEAARMGGLDNRVELAKDMLSFQQDNKYERLSFTEDADLLELVTKMSQQQLAYNTVLQSSAKIMQMSLTNFL